jgi:hypothetical protein
MNVAASFDAENSEFIEVDPTGRYGRVYTSLFALHLCLLH